MHWFAIALGGALGAMARHGVSTLVFDASSQKFPYATLSVNAQCADGGFSRRLYYFLNILA
jgi:fluoride ion exporter CrcB/FEX